MPRALRDVDGIHRYIAQHNPLAAQRLAQRLVKAGDSLDLFPERGRPIGASRRELLSVKPYIIRYRLRGEIVEILSVRHGARRPVP